MFKYLVSLILGKVVLVLDEALAFVIVALFGIVFIPVMFFIALGIETL